MLLSSAITMISKEWEGKNMPANVETMFYVGKMPWHRQGVALKDPPDTKTAIITAGLNWEVSKVDLYSSYGTTVKDYYGIMRHDNNEVLGVVGKGYIPLQNSEAFNLFDPLISSGFLEYETAGALGKGEIIWVLVKIKEKGSFEACKGDEINKYLLLSNSHDGQSAVNVKFTPIRVVCQNTLSFALDQGETTRIKHITSMKQQLDDVQVAVENICNIYSGVEEKYKLMAKHQISNAKVNEYFDYLYPVIDEKLIKTQSQYIKRKINVGIQNKLIRNFEEGFGVKELGIEGTLWAAYNAVTEFIDHPIDYKLGDNKLLKRIWFGDGEAVKKRAYTLAIGYLGVA